MLRMHLFGLFLCAGFLAACGHTTSPGSDSTGPSNDAVARLTVGVNGHGRVTSTPAGIDCGLRPNDGTVVQQLPSSAEQQCSFGACTCTWQWWPGYYGG